MPLKEEALQIFDFALKSVLPENLIKDKIKIENNNLYIEKDIYPLKDKFYILGSGKASVSMAKAFEKYFLDYIEDGLVISNYTEKLKKVKVLEGSHPLPTEKTIDATKSLIEKIKSLKENDFFIYLLSGGSSALLELPIEPITLEDLKITTNLLLKKSVPIDDINTVRKHISKVKGGRLAKLTKAKGVVLVISDVIGDNLETIGSAPLYMDKTTYKDAYNVLKKYNIWEEIPESVKTVIEKGLKGEIEETPKNPPENIKHYIIGNNSYMLNKAKEKATEIGYKTYIMTSSLHGEAKEVAKVIMSIAKEIEKSENPFKKPVCLLFGGETTVNVLGNGKGGRCQEMALSALKEFKNLEKVVFLAAGTDGIDGNSDADGAVIDKNDYLKANELGLNIDEYLKNNDSYNFFKKLNSLIFTGKTGTNVMDIQILIVG
ncbi:glycerate kinase type-2 family protein [Hydrogenothermus marinus]|uniref:Glycerate 2-kinase n=1 Tax=Hydrogenothermus marinus TaxID=133270 RepID=A0A3M0BSE6_9AQUI|nr:glycerate kinase [Hydrogenothermus marinus]RMA97758.1 glycerate 2-kinase [Hydrogenothermus marinus]